MQLCKDDVEGLVGWFLQQQTVEHATAHPPEPGGTSYGIQHHIHVHDGDEESHRASASGSVTTMVKPPFKIPFKPVAHPAPLPSALVRLMSQTSQPASSSTATPDAKVDQAPALCSAPGASHNDTAKDGAASERATPTSAWWENLILEGGSTQVSCYPYILRLPADGSGRTEISWPQMRVDELAIRQIWEKDWELDWRAEACDSDKNARFKRVVTDYSDLSVTVEWQLDVDSARSQGWARQHLVKSTPYVTVQLSGMSSVTLNTCHDIQDLQCYDAHSWLIQLSNGQNWALFTFAGQPIEPGSTSQDTSATTQDANEKAKTTWQSDGTKFSWRCIDKNSLVLSTIGNIPFTGVVRLAAVPHPLDESFDMLHKHHAVYPTGGSFTWQLKEDVEDEITTDDDTTDGSDVGSSHSSRQTSVMRFHYDKAGLDSSTPLLMLALPHHAHTLLEPRPDPQLFDYGRGYRCTKGRMHAVVGDCWTMLDYAPLVNWHADFDPAMLAKNRLAELCEAVDLDMKRATTPISSNPRIFGKEMVRLALLVLIAEHTGFSNRVDTVLDRMAEGLHPWLDPNSPTSFRYDITNGGLLTAAGANGKLDQHDGHAYYHDHHLHHGYFVHAAAVLARHRPDWWTAHRSAVLSICMDYFYMSSDRAASRNPFPRLRHFDPYDGHSWSNGTRVHPDGRSHIYSSRSVNAYYAVALLAEVDGWEELGVAARVVLGMELRATRTYWQMAPPTAHPAIPDDGLRYAVDVIAAFTARDGAGEGHGIMPWKKHGSESTAVAGEGRDQDELYGQPVIYPAPFRQRGVVGTLCSSRANYNSGLGNRPEYIYTVQFLPVTPITHALLDPCWLQRIWPILHHTVQRDNPCAVQWRGLIQMAGAVRGNTAAIVEAWYALSKMPPGKKPNDQWEYCNSKGNALYWVAANAAMPSRR